MSRSAGDRWADMSTDISPGLFGLLHEKSKCVCAQHRFHPLGFGDLDAIRCTQICVRIVDTMLACC